MYKEEAISLAVFLLFVFLAIATCILGVQQLPKITDRTFCVGKIGEETFFSGPSYQLSCESRGSTTACTIKTGFFLIMPDRHITSDKIKINCQ